MSNFTLGSKSIDKLKNIHKDMRSVVALAIEKTIVDFTVIEGVRTLERQKILVSEGKSQTLNSRHLTGHAVDLGAWVGNKINWDWQYYINISDAMKVSARQLRVQIEWGGDWKTLKDGVHFQLSRMAYPAESLC